MYMGSLFYKRWHCSISGESMDFSIIGCPHRKKKGRPFLSYTHKNKFQMDQELKCERQNLKTFRRQNRIILDDLWSRERLI